MSSETFGDLIRQAAERIRAAEYVVALTGAGISTPSGIPDFRSNRTGLWQKNDPMQVASLTAFRYRPQVFFDWLRPLAEGMLRAAPNPAHEALAHLEADRHLKALVTQNIDILHQRAGSKNVIEVHGSMGRLTCPQCRQSYPIEDYVEAFIERSEIPKCTACGAVLKPDIVLFEEMLPEDAWMQAERHFQAADLVLVVGSSLEVMPAGSLPLYALERGAGLIINTISATFLDDQADVLLPFDVAETLPAIVAELRKQ